jgi:hypothetical protein
MISFARVVSAAFNSMRRKPAGHLSGTEKLSFKGSFFSWIHI